MPVLHGVLLSGIRGIVRSPFVSILAIGSLGLSVGFSTAAFSFLDGLFLSPPPGISDPQRVVTVASEADNGPSALPVSLTTFQALQEESTAFSALSAAQITWLGLGLEDRPERAFGEIVSADYFETLGVRMAVGRGFLEEEGDPARPSRVVVLSHHLWRERFGADPGAVGQDLPINGRPYRIVGVAPAEFKGVRALNAPQVWTPLSTYREVFVDPAMFEARNGRVLGVVARLDSGRTAESARQEVEAIAQRLVERYPDDYRGQTLSVTPVEESRIYPDNRVRLWRAGLFLTVLGVALIAIACVNVANLLLIQAERRRRNVAVKLMLGVGRRRLTGELLAESGLIAVLGCALGLAVAAVVWKVLWHFRPPYFDENALGFSLAAPTVLFACLVGGLTSLLFGVVPAVRASRVSPAELLDSTGRSRLGRSWLGAGAWLVAAQVALGTVMTIGAGFFATHLADQRGLDLGIRTDRLLTVSWDAQASGYDESRGRTLHREIRERVRSIPGVEAATLAENRPLGGFRLLRELSLWERRADEGARHVAGSSWVEPGYFSILSIPVLRGRDFTVTDRRASARVAVVNRELAGELLPDDPLGIVGRRLWIGDWEEPTEVVGVAETIPYIHPREEPRLALYLPAEQVYTSRATLHVRTEGRPEALLGAVVREVRAVASDIPLIDVGTVDDHLDRALWAPRMNVAVLGMLSVFALALAAAGIYGVSSFAVACRTRDIGIRMALGAERAKVVREVVTRGLVWVGIGAAAGTAVAWGLGIWLARFFSDLGTPESGWLFIVLSTVLAVGGVANLAPAWRAARIDPVEALRF